MINTNLKRVRYRLIRDKITDSRKKIESEIKVKRKQYWLNTLKNEHMKMLASGWTKKMIENKLTNEAGKNNNNKITTKINEKSK